MFEFTIFGVRVTVEPVFWLITALLGGGFSAMQSNNPDAYLWVGVWMIVCFISIVAHELGHALTGRHLAGGRTWIRLWAMGGLAYHEGSRFTRNTRALTVIAGPGAGLGIFLIIACGMVLAWPGGVGLEILWKWMIWNEPFTQISFDSQIVMVKHYSLLRVINTFVWINFWWSLVNLLPIHPLDGGQLAECFIRSPKQLHKIGMITGVVVAVLGFSLLGSWYIGLLFGYLAYQNYQSFIRA